MKTQIVSQTDAIVGRGQAISINQHHHVLQHTLIPAFPETTQQIMFAMGCFWGVERLFWQQKGVYTTAVGYAGGYTNNPTYQEVCSGMTGHTEVVLVVYEPSVISLEDLLGLFWESHDPTQGMRQGNDQGTQYRSAIYVNNDQEYQLALKTKAIYQRSLDRHDASLITTEIEINPSFYYAEMYHQQYLSKNPQGYCNLMGTGIRFTAEGGNA